MSKRRVITCTSVLVTGFLGLCLPPRAAADPITYLVSVDTSSAAGTTGYLDMQFSSGNISNAPQTSYSTATATVSNFQTNGALTPEDPYSTPNYYGGMDAFGDVTGTLASPVSFNVDTNNFFGEYSQPITFGTTLSFDLTFSGPSVNTPCSPPESSGAVCLTSDFALDFFDTNGNFLFTDYATNPNDFILGYVFLNADTTTTVSEAPAPNGGQELVSFQQVTPAATPEPSSVALLGTGLLGAMIKFRRRALGQGETAAG